MPKRELTPNEKRIARSSQTIATNRLTCSGRERKTTVKPVTLPRLKFLEDHKEDDDGTHER